MLTYSKSNVGSRSTVDRQGDISRISECNDRYMKSPERPRFKTSFSKINNFNLFFSSIISKSYKSYNKLQKGNQQ